MNGHKSWRRRAVTFSVLALILFVAFAALRQPAANTSARLGSPPPDNPQFEGIPVKQQFPVPDLVNRLSRPRDLSQSGWQIIFEEDWESGFDPDRWLTIDRNGSQDGDYKWGLRDVSNPLGGGATSAWSIGGGQDGQKLDPSKNGYPARVDSWLIYGPFNLNDALDAELSFNYRFHADERDTFSVLVSTDGVSWEGLQRDDGGPGEWLSRNMAMKQYAGRSMVYLAFQFASNDDGNKNKNGAWVDDIVIRANYGSKQYLPHVLVLPTPTPPPTPTPAPTPPSNFTLDEFTNDISGWEARHAHNGTDYQYRHRGDEDGGRRGFLEMEVKNADRFVIVSPLLPAKEPPYNIEFYAKLKDVKDRHMYGIVFGADWNGQACNASASANCFNRYYELRVQYRDIDGAKFQEIKLKRIDSHDGNGEPIGPTLIDWKKGGNVNPDDWVEIDVSVATDGKIRVSWNDKFIAEAQDATLINQKYFGLLLITKENAAARVKYDYIKID